MADEGILLVASDYVRHLVDGDYRYSNGLATLDEVILLSADYVALFIADYGATLVSPPESSYVLAPHYAAGVQFRRVSIRLWTVDEGESNMRVELDITTEPPHRIVDGALSGCPPKIVPALQEVIHHLVVGDYRGLEEHGHLRRYGMRGEDLAAVLAEYRDWMRENGDPTTGAVGDCTPVDMPPHAFANIYAGHVIDTPGAWTADISLWWSEGCPRSDLTLRTEVGVTDAAIDVQVAGLEVM